MKTLIVLLCVLFAVPCMAADYSAVSTIQFTDTSVKSPGYHWLVFMSDASGNYDVNSPIADIPWTGDQEVYSAESSIIIENVSPGETITRYFTMQAVNSGGASKLSNEYPVTKTIPPGDLYIMTITIDIKTK